MSKHLKEFERDMSRVRYLIWIVQYIQEHQSDFAKQLSLEVEKKRKDLPAKDINSLAFDALRFVAVAENILLWMFYEKYNRGVHNGHDGTREVKKKCPDHLLRCHRDHPESHVLDIVKDFRDRSVHSLLKYNTLQCDRTPQETLLQSVFVRWTDLGKEVRLLHDLNKNEQLHQMKKGRSPRRLSSMTFGELLVSELVDCVRDYDRRFRGSK